MKSQAIAGNFKLRGKKHAMLTCGCCDVVNFTDSERIKAANDEIRQFNLIDMKCDDYFDSVVDIALDEYYANI